MKMLTLTLVLAVLLAPQIESSAVVEDKIEEKTHQARMDNSTFKIISNPITELKTAKSKQMSQPLLLQMAVDRFIDEANRKMSSLELQGALGGESDRLQLLGEMNQDFDVLQTQLNHELDCGSDVMGQLKQFSKSTPTRKWAYLWPSLESSIAVVNHLNDLMEKWIVLFRDHHLKTPITQILEDYIDLNVQMLIDKLDAFHKMVCPTSIVNQFESKVVPTDSEEKNNCSGGIMEAVQEMFNQSMSSGSLCTLPKSAHQLVYEFYTLLALTDAKVYATLQFFWMVLRLNKHGSNSVDDRYAVKAEEAQRAYQRRVIEKTNVAQSILSQTPTWKWQCDTPALNHTENQTFIQFKELLQGYIVNEVDLNQNNTCTETCPSYEFTQETSCYDVEFCGRSRHCRNGRIYNCGFIESNLQVCTSDTFSSGRRYDWIEYSSGRTLGHKSGCTSSGNQLHSANSWIRGFVHCSYCMCLCDQPGPQSDRFVSLQTVRSASGTNRLITGVKFVKIGRVVHIQIQEGQALGRGFVNESTVDWQPIVPIEINQPDSTEDGMNYATLNFEQRALDLDDLVAPEGHVVTGLRFRKLGGHLNLEMEASPIDYSSGFIDVERAIWMANDNTPFSELNPRRKLKLFAPDVPIRSHLPALPDSAPDQYLEFQVSSLEKDVSQTTVPFIDGTAVVTQPPSWLTGVGIYHKGQPGYGGYIAFRIATLNVSQHLNVTPSDFNP